MKKSVWSGQELCLGQRVTNFPVNTMSNSGNPPDRGPGGSALKNLQHNKLVANNATLSNSIPSASSAMHLYSATNSNSSSSAASASGQVASRMQNAVHSVLTTARQTTSASASTSASGSSLKSVNLVASSVSSNSLLNQTSSESTGERWTLDSGGGELLASSSSSSGVAQFSSASSSNNANASSSSINVSSLAQTQSSCSPDKILTTTRTVEQEGQAPTPSRPSPAQLFKSPDKTMTDFLYRRWEENRSSSLASFTLDWTLNQINKLNNVRKKKADVVQSDTGGNCSGSGSSLKRKASSSNLDSESGRNEAKRRRTAANEGLGLFSSRAAASACSQLPCLLSPLVVTPTDKDKEEDDDNSKGKSRGTTNSSIPSADGKEQQSSSTSASATPSTTASPELQNSLLSEFDPIKILSRFRSSRNSPSSSFDFGGDKSCSPSKTHNASVMNSKPFAQDLPTLTSWILSKTKGNYASSNEVGSVRLYKSARRLSDIQSSSRHLNDRRKNRRKLPIPWACRGASRSQKKSNPHDNPVRNRRQLRSNKVGLENDSTSNEDGTEVVYDKRLDDRLTISYAQIRLASVIYSRKSVKRSRRMLRSYVKKKTKGDNTSDEPLSSVNVNSIKKKNPTKEKAPGAKSSQKAAADPEVVVVNEYLINGSKGGGESRSNVKGQQEIESEDSTTVMIKIHENPLVDHAIELIRHKRDVQELIELMDERGIVIGLSQLPKLKSSPPSTSSTLNHNNIPLTSKQAKGILQKRLAILLAHGGFTHINLQPMCVLTDVLEEFYKKMAYRLKQITEMEMHGAEQEFPDALERTLVEFGTGGVRGLEEYYKDRIVGFRKRLEDQCVNLRSQYFSKLQAKAGITKNTPSSSSSVSSSSSATSSSSSSSNSQAASPGNRTLLDMLTGLKSATGKHSSSAAGSNSTADSESRVIAELLQDPSPKTSSSSDGGQEYQLQMTSEPSTPSSSSVLSQKPSSPSLKSLLNSNINSPGINMNHQGRRNPLPSPSSSTMTTAASSRSPLSNSNASNSIRQSLQQQQQQQFSKGSSLLRGDQLSSMNMNSSYGNASSSSAYQQQQSSNNMVSINLNNNVDLGGINSNMSGGAPLGHQSIGGGGSLMNSASKAKLKEAISQKNLLRLNFEQIPSNCDSTVLLSSSSPSLSAGNAAKQPSSASINQTTQLKL